jgi:riboflavin synthase
MFTGIIEELGEVRKMSRRSFGIVIEIHASVVAQGAKIGDSICVNGVCLTITAIEGCTLRFDAIEETLRQSALGLLKVRDKVNLERSLKVGDRIGGHFVMGHVDCIGVIRNKQAHSLTIAFPPEYRRYIIPKGSIAVDGISLTIASSCSNTLKVNIIPHTLHATTLSFKHHAAKINLEFDMLLKKNQ